jgi:hypothetical protein
MHLSQVQLQCAIAKGRSMTCLRLRVRPARSLVHTAYNCSVIHEPKYLWEPVAQAPVLSEAQAEMIEPLRADRTPEALDKEFDPMEQIIYGWVTTGSTKAEREDRARQRRKVRQPATEREYWQRPGLVTRGLTTVSRGSGSRMRTKPLAHSHHETAAGSLCRRLSTRGVHAQPRYVRIARLLRRRTEPAMRGRRDARPNRDHGSGCRAGRVRSPHRTFGYAKYPAYQTYHSGAIYELAKRHPDHGTQHTWLPIPPDYLRSALPRSRRARRCRRLKSTWITPPTATSSQRVDLQYSRHHIWTRTAAKRGLRAALFFDDQS